MDLFLWRQNSAISRRAAWLSPGRNGASRSVSTDGEEVLVLDRTNVMMLELDQRLGAA
jgi:hypothetical protein